VEPRKEEIMIVDEAAPFVLEKCYFFCIVLQVCS
jgi:hypothetical protein